MMTEVKIGQVWEAHDKKKSRRQVEIFDMDRATVLAKNVQTGRITTVKIDNLREHFVLIKDVKESKVEPKVELKPAEIAKATENTGDAKPPEPTKVSASSTAISATANINPSQGSQP